MLQEKAMLVVLSISMWTARKYDKKISQGVASLYHTDVNMGRYNKVVIAESALKEIQQIVGSARTFHYENTLPWSDEGVRILPVANFFTYTQKMQDYRIAFERAVESFVDNYPDLVEDAKQRLNGMFNAMDYPSTSDLLRKYDFRVTINPMPQSSDFRVTLDEDEVEAIRGQITERVEQATQAAMKDLYDRLFVKVKHVVDRLTDPKGKFHDTLVSNVEDLVSLLPKLNLTNDPTLAQLCEVAKEKLCKYQPETLRVDAAARVEVARDAKKMMNDMLTCMS